MDIAGGSPIGQPRTLQDIALALDAASPVDIETSARLFDEARSGLRAIAESLDRALSELDDAWRSTQATGVRLSDPARRTRELVHTLDDAECGRQLRVTANALGVGQSRVRDLQAQRAADSGSTDDEWDRRAQVVLHGLAEAYRDVGLGLGGQNPPTVATVDEPGDRHARAESAGDDPPGLVLAADSDAADLFRPAAPTVRANQPGETVAPPSGGGGGTGSGLPMMPLMPMGGMGGGMGGGLGGMQNEGGGQRRGSTLAQGDPAVWKDADAGWHVLGRTERIDQHIQEGLRKELGDVRKGDRDG
ncbi:hypothetical protein [Micromonospora sp. NPDC085948]|uniref:hypothetical protein n=1 Tax=Micromonospora sp. NPDC085948 TaxID=3155293 RepID=UPI0034450179